MCSVLKNNQICNLFFQTHGGLLCQFCLKLFKKVGEIEVHLKKVHRVSRWYFPSAKMFTAYAGHAYSFICSICNVVMVGKVKKSNIYKLSVAILVRLNLKRVYMIDQYKSETQNFIIGSILSIGVIFRVGLVTGMGNEYLLSF